MKSSEAYWISPRGKIIDIDRKHIDAVISNPKLFGLSTDDIKKIHNKHGEKIGIEGHARGEIMLSLMKQGWTRVRYFGRNDMWQFQTFYYGKREKDNLWKFISDGMDSNIVKKYADLVVLITKTGRKISSSASNLTSLFERKNILSKIGKKVMNESSLYRIYSMNEKHDCGALTAFRKARDCGKGEPYTRKENKQRNKSLLSKLMAKGYSVTTLLGKYPEGGVESKETSYFVVDIKNTGDLLKDLKQFGKDNQQDSILFIPRGTVNGDDKAFLIGTNHCENNWLGYGKKEFFGNGGKFGKSSKIYTSYVNGRPFIFEEYGKEIIPPGNGMGWWYLNIVSKKSWTKL